MSAPDVTQHATPALIEAGEVANVIVYHGDANSHVFDDRIIVNDKCVAFADEPWTTRIADALRALSTASPPRSLETADVRKIAREIVIALGRPGKDGISSYATRQGAADDKPYIQAVEAILCRHKLETRNDAIRDAAAVAMTHAIKAGGAEGRARRAAEADGSTAGRQVELEEAVGFGKMARTAHTIAKQILSYIPNAVNDPNLPKVETDQWVSHAEEWIAHLRSDEPIMRHTAAANLERIIGLLAVLRHPQPSTPVADAEGGR